MDELFIKVNKSLIYHFAIRLQILAPWRKTTSHISDMSKMYYTYRLNHKTWSKVLCELLVPLIIVKNLPYSSVIFESVVVLRKEVCLEVFIVCLGQCGQIWYYNKGFTRNFRVTGSQFDMRNVKLFLQNYKINQRCRTDRTST